MGEQLSISRMEELLLKEQHVLAISRDPEYKMPEIDLSSWMEEDRSSRRGGLDFLAKYLNRPYVEDDFGSNNLHREKWREELGMKYNWFSKYIVEDALRVNSFNDLMSVFWNIRDGGYIGTNKVQLSQLIKELRALIPSQVEYTPLPTSQKKERVMAVKIKVYEILEFLSKQSVAR